MKPEISCVTCGEQYRPRKNEVFVCVEEDSQPYQYYYADLWECPGCGHQVVSGYGNHPVAEWHDQEKMAQYAEEQCYIVNNKLRGLK